MEALAKLRNCPMSARKMRLVTDLIRGKNVDDALNILKYTKKEAAYWAEKTVLSAISNWEYKNDMAVNADDYDLFVKEIFSDEGSMLKRFRPAPHGRAHRIRKRTNHLTVIVENRVPLEGRDEDEVFVEELEEEVEELEEDEIIDEEQSTEEDQTDETDEIDENSNVDEDSSEENED